MSVEPTRPYPPGEQEKAEYYDGLDDQPKLVARTSATPFVPNGTWDKHQWRHLKRREPIRYHDIISKYSRAFAADIISALGDFSWHRFYPICIYDQVTSRRSIVFIIETLSDSEPWETSIEVALSCRNVIHSIEITDVEVEIQRVTEVRFAANKELDSFTDAIRATAHTPPVMRDNLGGVIRRVFQDVFPFSSHIGSEINNPKFDKTGTMGLHLRLGDADKSYCLTCRHVVLDSIDRPSVDINIDISGDKTMSVQQLSHTAATELVDSGIKLEINCRKMHKALADKIHDWDEWYSTTEETAEAKKSRCPTSEERERLPRLSNHLSQVTKASSLMQSAKDQSPIIGHLASAPSYAKSSRGLLVDWALVELDTANGFAAHLTNKVYIGHEVAQRRDVETSARDVGDYTDLFRESPGLTRHLDDDGFLRIVGVVPTPTDGKAAGLPVGMQGKNVKPIIWPDKRNTVGSAGFHRRRVGGMGVDCIF